MVKNLPPDAEDVRDSDLILGGEEPWRRNTAAKLQDSCLEDPMDRDYSPQGQKESNTTEATQFHTHTRTQTRAHCPLLKHTDRKGRANGAGTSTIPLSSMLGLGQLTRPVTDRPPSPLTSLWVPSWWGVTTSQVCIFRILRKKPNLNSE